MSNLRLIALILGAIGLLFTFFKYRGVKWNRFNFILFASFSLFLIIVSINPDFVNLLRDILSLQNHEYGRLFALLIFSNFFLLFYAFSSRSKIEKIRIQFDKLIRTLGSQSLKDSYNENDHIKAITVIIPAYNEADNLKELLPKVPKQINGIDVGVLVIDDGSQDDTVRVIQNMEYLVVSNSINRGQGAASRLGYDILRKNNVTVGVTMDADNQHNPQDIATMVMPILNDQYDLVIGSRILGNHEKATWFRSIGIVFFSKIISLITGQRISDSSSGFKAFNMDRIKELNLNEDQFQSAEVLIEASKKGLRIGDVPITIKNRRFGASKKGTDLGYGFNFAKIILKTWWRS
jgi:hypothetical protein